MNPNTPDFEPQVSGGSLSRVLESDDLDWRAFLYLSDELPADAVDAFELELLNSQSAREALATAVELQHAIQLASGSVRLPADGSVLLPADRSVLAAAESPRFSFSVADPVVSSGQMSRWMQPAVWLATGAAACLLLMIGLQSWRHLPGDGQKPTLSSADSAALALQWSNVRESWDEISSARAESPRAEMGEGSPLDLSGGEYTSLGSDNADSVEGLESPDWLLATIADQSELPDTLPAPVVQE